MNVLRGEGFWQRRMHSPVKAFRAPKRSLGDLDAEAAATLIAASSDIALVIDDQGIIRDVAFNSEDLAHDLESAGQWVGRPWIDTVSIDSRGKVEALLKESASRADPKWRHLNHPVGRDLDVPILYSAVRVGQDGRVVAFGRDLRAMSALQQRLMDAQESMERDYSRMRHVETRYRLLFVMSSEAVVIVDATSLRMVEANPAARALFGEAAPRAQTQPFAELFDETGAQSVLNLLAAVRAVGRADDVRTNLADNARELTVSASLFRQDNTVLFLVRLAPVDAVAAQTVLPLTKSKLLKVVENAPDGIVVTDDEGAVITANAAFVEMAQVASEEQARGQNLERWVGRPGVDLAVLLSNLRQRGAVRLFATTMHGEYGTAADVEISAVSVMNGGKPCFGFAVRNVGNRLTEQRAGRALPRSIEHVTELIGRVALKDLVREATDVIERLCIEAALELTGDNRASAAEILGLSRQSLYVKLRRYGLGDLAAEGGT
jgi:transcriptional regulator PpsR